MSEFFIITTARPLGRPEIVRDKDRVAAVQRMESLVRGRHGEAVIGNVKGNTAIRRFLEATGDHLNWGDYRLDAYTQENK